MSMNGVYVLVQDRYNALRIIRIPPGMEEKDFRAKVESETGLTVQAVVYGATLTGLKRENESFPIPRVNE
jgi:hypothetical protein